VFSFFLKCICPHSTFVSGLLLPLLPMKNWFIKQHNILAWILASFGTVHWIAKLRVVCLVRGHLEVQHQLMQRLQYTVACKQKKWLITHLHGISLFQYDHGVFTLFRHT